MLCHFFVSKKWQSNVICKNVNNLCVMCVCVHAHVYIYERDREKEKEREIFLPFSIVLIIKNNKINVFVFVFFSKWHGKSSQILLFCGGKKNMYNFFWIYIPSMEWKNQSQQLHWASLTVYFKNAKCNPKSWLMLLLPCGFCLYTLALMFIQHFKNYKCVSVEELCYIKDFLFVCF